MSQRDYKTQKILNTLDVDMKRYHSTKCDLDILQNFKNFDEIQMQTMNSVRMNLENILVNIYKERNILYIYVPTLVWCVCKDFMILLVDAFISVYARKLPHTLVTSPYTKSFKSKRCMPSDSQNTFQDSGDLLSLRTKQNYPNRVVCIILLMFQ